MEACLIAIDTETHGSVPFSLQVSLGVGTALMVLCSNIELVQFLVYNINKLLDCGYEVVLHNSVADLPLLSQLGIKWQGRFRDTMQESYSLNQPQGLKALSYRLLGRRRKSWDETVTPYSKDKLREWITDSILLAQENLTVQEPRYSKKTNKVLKPKVIKHEFEKTLTSILGHMERNTDYDPFNKLVERMEQADLDWIGDMLGRKVPVKGIAHCPIDVAVNYGCSDADDTLAVALELERLRKDIVEVDEGDWDE